MTKLNPDTLEVVSFPTADPAATSYVLQQANGISDPDICHVWFSECADCF